MSVFTRGSAKAKKKKKKEREKKERQEKQGVSCPSLVRLLRYVGVDSKRRRRWGHHVEKSTAAFFLWGTKSSDACPPREIVCHVKYFAKVTRTNARHRCCFSQLTFLDASPLSLSFSLAVREFFQCTFKQLLSVFFNEIKYTCYINYITLIYYK